MSAMVRSIHRTRQRAERSAANEPGSRVEWGAKGTNPERPWAVVVDRKGGGR